MLFAEMTVEARGRAPRDSSNTGVRIGQAQEEGGEGGHTAAEVKQKPVLRLWYLKYNRALRVLAGKGAAGLYPGIPPITPPPAGFQNWFRERRRTRG